MLRSSGSAAGCGWFFLPLPLPLLDLFWEVVFLLDLDEAPFFLVLVAFLGEDFFEVDLLAFGLVLAVNDLLITFPEGFFVLQINQIYHQ